MRLGTANTLRLSSDRWQKLTADNKQEARYHSQHAAISKALAQEGKQMLKRNSWPIFQIRGTDIEIHHMRGVWWSDDIKTQFLINRAIASITH